MLLQCLTQQGHSMSQSYSFPVLSDQELIPWLREFDMPLTAAQLAKPTYELVKPVFEIAVAALVCVTRSAAASYNQALPAQADIHSTGQPATLLPAAA